MLDLDTIDFGSLRAHLSDHLNDWRKRRGIRHSHGSLFTIAVAAALSGARSVVAIGEFAGDLPQEALARLGARNKAGRFAAPHTDTFRRAFEGVDVDALDTAIGSWLRANLPTSALDAIALDGKTLRGAWTPDRTQVQLLAAMVHKEGAVIAQREVPTDKTNEITQVRPLLEDLDIDSTVITADALHTQRDHAKFLVGEKNADYVFTVKGNQPNLLAEIEDRFDGPFFPLTTKPLTGVTVASKPARSPSLTHPKTCFPTPGRSSRSSVTSTTSTTADAPGKLPTGSPA